MRIRRKNAVAQCRFCGYHNKTKSDRAERERRHRPARMIEKGDFTMRSGKRTFKHLSKNDRLRIEKWQRMGMKPREIAEKLRVHISTVYRELKRGEYERLDGGTWEMVTAYSPDIAEARYQEHLREKGPDLKIGKDHELANYIETTITSWQTTLRQRSRSGNAALPLSSDMQCWRGGHSRHPFPWRRSTATSKRVSFSTSHRWICRAGAR